MFQIGNRVLWISKSSLSPAIGTIVNVIANDDNLSDFTLYDVEFPFGIRTIYGSALRALPMVSACAERARLLAVYQKAFDVHMKILKELVNGPGMMAHTEFEFLRRKLETVRDVAQAARREFDEHTAEHRC